MSDIWWECKECGKLILENDSGWRKTAKHAKISHGDITNASFTALSHGEVKSKLQ